MILISRSLTNFGVRLFKAFVFNSMMSPSGSVQAMVAVKSPFPEAINVLFSVFVFAKVPSKIKFD